MEITVEKFGGGQAGSLELPDTMLMRAYNENLVHQMTVAAQANARTGTRAQKNRAEVHHSTRKLFRQKGTGRARAGASSSPIRRGGGRAFPASPTENFKHKTPRKMFRAAMAMMLSKLAQENRLKIVELLTAENPKTRDLVKRFSNMKISGKILLVADREDHNLELATRNLPNVFFLRQSALNASSFVVSRYSNFFPTSNA